MILSKKNGMILSMIRWVKIWLGIGYDIMQFEMILCVWYDTVWYDISWFNRRWYDMIGMIFLYGYMTYLVWYITGRGLILFYMVWYDYDYDMKWYNIIWSDLIWYELYHIVTWFVMIWYDIIWYDMIWYMMVWHDMVWNNTICYNILLCDM